MPEITRNEEINKSVEPEIARIILELLTRYNVPAAPVFLPVKVYTPAD